MRRILGIAALGALALTPLIASASNPVQTLTTKLTSTATIVAGCTALSQSTALSFGAAIAPSTTPSATGGISATCANNVSATLTFDNGANPSAAPAPQLAGPGATGTTRLGYGIFSDAAFSVPITATGITFTGTGTAKITPVYAKLSAPVPVDTLPGVYTDSITVTLSF